MRHLVSAVKEMHAGVQPLKVFHFGGDEVANGAWMESPACIGLSLTDRHALKQRFVQELAVIVHEEGLDMAGWEDGFMSEGNLPFNRTLFPNTDVFGYPWQNISYGSGVEAAAPTNSPTTGTR